MTTERQKKRKILGEYVIPDSLKEELNKEYATLDSMSEDTSIRGLNKNDYQQRKYNRVVDLDLDNIKSYKEIMYEREFEREEVRVNKLIQQKEEDDGDKGQKKINGNDRPRKRKKRWDVGPQEYEVLNSKENIEERDILIRNVPIINGIPLTDAVLKKLLPPGYRILDPPQGYIPNDIKQAPDITQIPGDFYLPPASNGILDQKSMVKQLAPEIPITGIQYFKEEDAKYFGQLINPNKSDNKSAEEKMEIKALGLLLRIKNGSQSARKKAMRQLTDNAKKFGPKVLLNKILPILIEPNLDDQERHLLVKLIGRLLFQLDDLIRPYTHKILFVISPLLIDEDFSIRLEARDIVSSLSKAAGLADMISSLRPDIDHVDEYVRNITSRVFAIVANTLGLVNFLPFLKAVIKSKKNWMARHTGIKIVQQLCVLLGRGNGNSILPFLTQIVEVMKPGLTDEMLQVRTMTALTISQLADNVKPYGIESFEPILEPAWLGLKRHRGKGLASFLKCIGSVINLMTYDPNYEEYSSYYTNEIMLVIRREFNSPDDDMKKTILRVILDLPLSRQLFRNYQNDIIKPFLKSFWNRRVASDSQQLAKNVVECTSTLAVKLDYFTILDNVITFTKDENESLRRMAIETINKMITTGSENLIGLDSQTETKLIDGVLFAFQEQTIQHKIYLQTFGTVSNSLGVKLKPHLNSIISTILYRLKNKLPEVRQQSSDLISIIAPTVRKCSEDNDTVLTTLILVLYELLGEVYPDVLGSIINALFSCINSVDPVTLYTMSNPSVNQLLPTLTPILKNRHDKVQEACIKLVGLIAQKNSETINAKEWMRICFELLDMLKSPKKRIRIATNDTFGFIAKTIGPQDVLVMLLNNLRVQERQLRVCTAVAIGIVAETCAPFTVLPALMNEYRIPEKNVQNGVLKALSFLFEYIDGTMTKDYLFAVTPLIEDALTDRDQVHRQTAATVIRHMAINCVGLTNDDYYDVFVHFLNLLLPNIYETSPHVISRILESIEALRVVLGIGSFSNYIWSGLFHPARKVRSPYWKMFNSAYVQSSDSIVPYYPRIDYLADSPNEDYRIEELDIYL
ncbi:uncharacterized protein PRCAT00000381001 [Priceomyces carsonii]|uniref:uncharacterized protein n=1 Tax=Priceomyces carsonii TaxID=28549 RepID=UPI002ED8F63E|nr:unnamed protein product [Priceomyces carsonii]